MINLSLKKNVRNWLKLSLGDPIAKILANNSHLTMTQLETLLIDALADNMASKHVKYDEKAKLRQTKAAVSRGSFNRTLRQAKKNVIQSIYTILLLGYLGLIENTDLYPYLEASNKLKAYTTTLADFMTHKKGAKEQLRIIETLRLELETTLNSLSKPWKTVSM